VYRSRYTWRTSVVSQGETGARRFQDTTLVWIEKTTQLVTTGVFKYIRHPLYSSLLLLAWGVFFKRPHWDSGGVVLGATVSLVVTAKVEETKNIQYFGAAYRLYMQQTKMFIPVIF
jgi:protein-S-isoprenylcysteine O-methyltransferase Ste14